MGGEDKVPSHKEWCLSIFLISGGSMNDVSHLCLNAVYTRMLFSVVASAHFLPISVSPCQTFP